MRVEIVVVDVVKEVMDVDDRLVDESDEDEGVDGRGEKDGGTAAGAKGTVLLDGGMDDED